MKNWTIISILCLLGFCSLAACTQEDTTNTKKENESEQVKPDDEQDKEKEDTTLGNPDILINTEVTIEKDKIIIEGESNLLPDTKINSNGKSEMFADADFIDSTTVQDDGSFSFEFPFKSEPRQVTLRLNNNSDDATELYGANFEKVTGPHVYQTDTHGEYEVKVNLDIDVTQDLPYSYTVHPPKWDEQPDDYGDPDVWMEAEADNDHHFLYFHGQSNLMEGAQIGGNLMTADDNIEPFAHGFTRINPDGSFELKVPYHSLRPGMYMPITYEPKRNTWEDIVNNYGEKGENFTGDLVVQEDDEQTIVLNVKLDVPDFNPPEDIDLTFQEEEVKMQVPDDLLFDFDDSTLKDKAKETLDGVISELETLDDDTPIQINGHSDNQGDSDYNMDLSKERAEAVWNYLSDHGKTDKLDVSIEGYGDTEPIASNDDTDGQKRNRRVEIVINPE